jgi:hypothetical protein
MGCCSRERKRAFTRNVKNKRVQGTEETSLERRGEEGYPGSTASSMGGEAHWGDRREVEGHINRSEALDKESGTGHNLGLITVR